jgi:hypothetical protein
VTTSVGAVIATPTLKKMRRVKPQSQPIGEFLEWLKRQGLAVCDEENGEWNPISMSTERLLAKYFKIDLLKADKEKQALLDAARRAS